MIYLDAAATSLQKPAAVSRAVAKAIDSLASPGRGGHSPAMAAAQEVFDCREAAARLFHVPDPGQVVFTFNATHGLNLAIKSVVEPGDTVLVSGYEHNAVTRPLTALGCDIRVARGPLFEPDALLADFREKLTPRVKCVVTTHVSNVFGYRLPVEEMAALCRERGIPLILDASQSAGSLPVHMDELGAAYIAMPGHKGLYGPQGTGLLLCAEGQVPMPLLEGGTGSLSALQVMPDFLPDRLEGGTHNVCGIAGLLEGLRYVASRGEGRILRHEQALCRRCAKGLEKIPGITVYWDRSGKHQTGVVSFVSSAMDCETLGERLGRQGIALRAGLHCAPFAHETAGTLQSGTVRLSFSAFNVPNEVDTFLRALARLRAWRRENASPLGKQPFTK